MRAFLICFLSILTLSSCSSREREQRQLSEIVDIEDETTARNANILKDADIFKEAKKRADTFDKQYKIAAPGNPYNLRLQRIVKGRLNEKELNVDLKVYLDPKVNIATFANGSVRVFSGLMDRLNDEELFAVVAHDLSHLQLGHYKRELPIQFSLEDEEEADRYIATLLQGRQYNSASLVSSLTKLAIIANEEKNLSIITETHPQPYLRAQSIAHQQGEHFEEIEFSAARSTDKTPASGKFKGWIIQVSAETEIEDANYKVSRLSENGILAEVQKATVDGADYFRVIVGPYRSKQSAQEDLERITNFGVNQGTPFIKVFSQ